MSEEAKKIGNNIPEDELLSLLGQCNEILKNTLNDMASQDWGDEYFNDVYKLLRDTNNHRMEIEEMLMNKRFNEDKFNKIIKTN